MQDGARNKHNSRLVSFLLIFSRMGLLLTLILSFLISCAEDTSGTRLLELPQEEEAPDQCQRDPNTVCVRCFSSEDESDLLYLIRASTGRFNYVNCAGAEDNCEDRKTRLILTSTGTGNLTRPCLSEIDLPSRFRFCLSSAEIPPENQNLVRITGEEGDMIFDFFCEEKIVSLLR